MPLDLPSRVRSGARPRNRRTRSLLVTLTIASLAVGACSAGATPVPTPADAVQLTAAVAASLSGIKQVDARLALSGTLDASDGSSPAASPLTLDGAVVELKSDTAAGAAEVTATLPAAIAGGGHVEAIVVGKDVYLKLGSLGSLLGVADDGKFHHTTTDALAGLGGMTGLPIPSAVATPSAMPSELAAGLDQLRAYLAGLAQAPTISSVTCGRSSCWDLHVVLGPSDLAALAAQGEGALASAVPLGGVVTGGASDLAGVTLDVLVRQADSRPAEVKATVDAGSAGTATVDLTLTFDQPATISVPPADQVVEGLPSVELP